LCVCVCVCVCVYVCGLSIHIAYLFNTSSEAIV